MAGERTDVGPDEHGDVIELERISALASTDPNSVEQIVAAPPGLEEEYPIIRIIEHAKRCKICAAGVLRFAACRPQIGGLSD